jgi:hypothetical protein
MKQLTLTKASVNIKKQKKRLKSNITYDKKIARRYHPTAYYRSMASDIKNLQ